MMFRRIDICQNPVHFRRIEKKKLPAMYATLTNESKRYKRKSNEI